MSTEWKHCNRCDNVLMGSEQLSDTCNRCLDLDYASMTEEEYALLAPNVFAYEELYDKLGAERWHALTFSERVKQAGLEPHAPLFPFINSDEGMWFPVPGIDGEMDPDEWEALFGISHHFR